MMLARALSFLMLLCAGCAHLPDGKVTYYLAESKVRFKVVRTLACDAGGRVLSSSAVTPSVTHGADVGRRFDIPFAELRSFFADSDVKIDFYDDGRLKNVNGTLTGHGEEIFKTLTSIVSVVAAQRNLVQRTERVAQPTCNTIEQFAGGKNKALTLNYEADVDPRQAAGVGQPIGGDALSQAYVADLNTIGTVCAFVDSVQLPPAPFTRGKPGDGVLITVRQPALVRFSVRTGSEKGACADEVWNALLPVAQLGTEYVLPLQKAPVFGTQKFILSLQESGALASLQYASTSGTGQALNVVNDALTQAQNQAAKQAQAITDEINLMLAQQRLVKCRANPAECK
jgi:hypothetical protein